MPHDRKRKWVITAMLIGAGMLLGAAIDDAWSESNRDYGPTHYWVVAEVRSNGEALPPTPIAVGAEVSGRSHLRGGACHYFVVGTDEPFALDANTSGSGEIGLHITGPVWFPHAGDTIRTRCDPGPQLDYESTIKNTIDQAERWEWNGTEFRVFGAQPGDEVAFVDLLQQD